MNPTPRTTRPPRSRDETAHADTSLSALFSRNSKYRCFPPEPSGGKQTIDRRPRDPVAADSNPRSLRPEQRNSTLGTSTRTNHHRSAPRYASVSVGRAGIETLDRLPGFSQALEQFRVVDEPAQAPARHPRVRAVPVVPSVHAQNTRRRMSSPSTPPTRPAPDSVRALSPGAGRRLARRGRRPMPSRSGRCSRPSTAVGTGRPPGRAVAAARRLGRRGPTADRGGP